MKGFASSSDRLNKAKKIEAILKNHLKTDIKNLKILDIGSGDGMISNYFSENNSVYSVDVEDQRIYKKSKFKTVESEKLPFDNKHFDIVISNQVIEHLENSDLHLNEIHRPCHEVAHFVAPNSTLHKAFLTRCGDYRAGYQLLIL